jgi:hypothetical protein
VPEVGEVIDVDGSPIEVSATDDTPLRRLRIQPRQG